MVQTSQDVHAVRLQLFLIHYRTQPLLGLYKKLKTLPALSFPQSMLRRCSTPSGGRTHSATLCNRRAPPHSHASAGSR